jgi:DNA-binding GntR family transcriptional regulator
VRLLIISFYNDRLRDHGEHLEIFQAISERRGKVAGDVMHSHLNSVRAVVEKRRSRNDPKNNEEIVHKRRS